MAKKGKFTDPRDGQVYKTVKIGNQIWMAKNLNYTIDNEIGCYYENDEKYKKYGRLYDWTEAMCISPPGWHLPTNKEWDELIKFVGGKDIAEKYLKSKSRWNKDGNGTDDFSFSALPGGYGNSNGYFYYVGINGCWWSAEESDAENAWYWNMHYDISYVDRNNIGKSYLFSIR